MNSASVLESKHVCLSLIHLQLTGTLLITQAGEYTFYLTSDDGSRLWLDNEVLIDNGGLVRRNVSASLHLV